MGLLPESTVDPSTLRAGQDIALLHRMECRVCPLARETGNLHPQMAPTGSDKPLIYALGEAPGRTEDEQNRQFVGDSGELLRPLIPAKYRKRIRWNNCVRTRPPKNRNPTPVELECCRPSIVRDVEATKPAAIFGFGNVPLEWAIGQQGVTLWRGRRLPVRVGKHTCWYYPMLHPAYLVRKRRGGRASDEEVMFKFDLEHAFADLEDLPAPVVHTAQDARTGTEIIVDGGRAGLRQVREALEWATAQPVVGVDYETNCLRPYRHDAKILSAAVGTPQRTIAFPFEHPDAQWSDRDLDELVEMWCTFLRAPRVRKAVHNLAFELEWTGVCFGEEYVRAGIWEDTATQAAILDERHKKMKGGPFSLDWLVLQYFGYHLKSLFPGLDRANLENTPLETVLAYNAPDSKYHAALWGVQDALIRAQGLEEPYQLALRRVPTVVLSQMLGVPVDQKEVRALKAKYDPLRDNTMKAIADLPVVKQFKKDRGKDFKPLSDPDVQRVFVDMLKRPECLVEDKFTKKQKYSADESVLSQIDHPLASLVLDYRHYNKRVSTYIDPLLEGSPILYDDGCLHTNFNTFFVATGRLSSDGPNLQNFPKRDGEAVEVRRPIKAPPGHVILAFDYGQIEARVIAMLSRDERFMKALWDRYDVHMEWAERLARAYPRRIGGKSFLTDKKVLKTFRTDVKNQWTFPLFFGAGRSSAAGYLKIPEEAIEGPYEEFWEEFAGIAEWQKDLEDFYHQHGYVECATGRRRRGPLSINKIINTPVQGTAAELVLDAMCRLSETGDPELQPELNIHDDLSFLRVREDRVDEVAAKVLDHMLDIPFEWARTVPITVEMACGKNWMPYDKVTNPDGLQDIGDYSSDEWLR